MHLPIQIYGYVPEVHVVTFNCTRYGVHDMVYTVVESIAKVQGNGMSIHVTAWPVFAATCIYK